MMDGVYIFFYGPSAE